MKNSARTGKTLQHIVLAVMLVFGLAFSFTYAKAEESASGIAASSSTEQTQTEKSKDAATAGTTTTDQSAETSEEAAESSETATTESSEDTSSSALASAKPSLATTLAAASGTSYTYNIYWYALIPGHDANASGDGAANANLYGLGVGTVSGTNVQNPRDLPIGRVDLSGATISTVTPPPIRYNGVTYMYAAPGSGNENSEYYYTLVDMRYVVANGANAGNNDKNHPTVPSGYYTYHFDHTLVLNSPDNYISVTFAVDYPDDTQEFVTDENWSKRVEKGSLLGSIAKPSYGTPTDFTETKTVNGVTYEFDGWYTDSDCKHRADFKTGTVNENMTFYGHYVAKTGNLTVSKTVAGNAANVTEEFNFTLTCIALKDKTYDGVEFGSDGVASFQLMNGESKTINGLPAGSQIAIQETGLSGNAKTSTTVSVDEGTVKTMKAESSDATSTDPETVTITNGHTTTAAFTNTANAVSDTGISINTTPMAALAAFAAAGGIALAAAGMRKRNGERKER